MLTFAAYLLGILISYFYNTDSIWVNTLSIRLFEVFSLGATLYIAASFVRGISHWNVIGVKKTCKTLLKYGLCLYGGGIFAVLYLSLFFKAHTHEPMLFAKSFEPGSSLIGLFSFWDMLWRWDSILWLTCFLLGGFGLTLQNQEMREHLLKSSAFVHSAISAFFHLWKRLVPLAVFFHSFTQTRLWEGAASTEYFSFLLGAMFLAVFFLFFCFPALLRQFVPEKMRDIVEKGLEALVVAFCTSSVLIALPYAVEVLRHTPGKFSSQRYQLIYSHVIPCSLFFLPRIGDLFLLMFVFAVGSASGVSLGMADTFLLIVKHIFMSVGHHQDTMASLYVLLSSLALNEGALGAYLVLSPLLSAVGATLSLAGMMTLTAMMEYSKESKGYSLKRFMRNSVAYAPWFALYLFVSGFCIYNFG